MGAEAMMLYRFYDADGHLLYIGITRNWHERRQQHARYQPWWDDVAYEFVMPIEGREEAMWAEKAAIRSERPHHNVVHIDPLDAEWTCSECGQADPPSVCSPCAYDHGRRAGMQRGLDFGSTAWRDTDDWEIDDWADRMCGMAHA